MYKYIYFIVKLCKRVMCIFVKPVLSIKMKKLQVTLLFILYVSVTYYLLLSGKKRESAKFKFGFTLPNDKVHIFYDGSFRNLKLDDTFQGWYVGSEGARIFDSAYYPQRGLYSSNDPNIVDLHMHQIRDSGAGVVVVSWWPEDHDKSPPMDLIMTCAEKYGLKVTIHIQKYERRSLRSVMKNIVDVFNKYGNHAAFYKTKIPTKRRKLPMIYIYDSLSIKPVFWNVILNSSSKYTIRKTQYDALFIGSIADETDKHLVANSDFDGFYTMFCHINHTYASNWFNWPHIEDFARNRQLIFIPTVSPGYDYRLPAENVKSALIPSLVPRNLGYFYHNAWSRALISRSKYIAINSFNDWLAGTQIEPARYNSKNHNEEDDTRIIRYNDYSPGTGRMYMKITVKWVIEFSNRRSLYRGA